MEQKIKARIVLAHADAKTDNSKKALPNELILYDFNKKIGNSDRTEIRLRIGDGTTSISGLPDLVLDNMNFYDSEPEKPELGDVWYNETEETFYLGTGEGSIKLSHVIENIEDGLGNKSIQTTDSSTAYNNYGAALGYGNVSGAKAFSFKLGHNYTDDDIQNKRYYLNSVTDIETEDEFSIILNNNYDYHGKITSIDTANNYITVDNYIEPKDNDKISSNSYLLIPSKPEVGDKIIGTGATATGYDTKALGAGAHSEGYGTTAAGKYSHTEGKDSKAGYASHAEGSGTTAKFSAHAEGGSTTAWGDYSHAEGINTVANGHSSHAEGQETAANETATHAEGYSTKANGKYTHAEGVSTIASEMAAHAEGNTTEASGKFSHAEGSATKANGENSHAEGTTTIASGNNSHAEGNGTTASGNAAHTEGQGTIASGDQAHAEGYKSQASYQAAHAEGYVTTATKIGAHAEGSSTEAIGDGAHAEGYDTIASGPYSHAEGSSTTAVSFVTHAEGQGTIARGNAQHVQGKYNIEDTNKEYAHIVGNGTSNEQRSNAHTVDWDGNAWYVGDIIAGTEDNQKDIIATGTLKGNSLDAITGEFNTINVGGEIKASIDKNGNIISPSITTSNGNFKNIIVKREDNNIINLKGETGEINTLGSIQAQGTGHFDDGLTVGGRHYGSNNYENPVLNYRGVVTNLTETTADAKPGDIVCIKNLIEQKILGFRVPKYENFEDAIGTATKRVFNFQLCQTSTAYDMIAFSNYDNSPYNEILSYLLNDILYNPLGKPGYSKAEPNTDILNNRRIKIDFGPEQKNSLIYIDKIEWHNSSTGQIDENGNMIGLWSYEYYGTYDENGKVYEDFKNYDVTFSVDDMPLYENIPENMKKYAVIEPEEISNYYLYDGKEWNDLTYNGKQLQSLISSHCMPTIGYSNNSKYKVSVGGENIVDLLKQAFNEGESVVYIESGKYTSSKQYVLPQGNFTIIGLGDVNFNFVIYDNPTIKNKFIYTFNNITFSNDLYFDYITDDKDGAYYYNSLKANNCQFNSVISIWPEGEFNRCIFSNSIESSSSHYTMAIFNQCEFYNISRIAGQNFIDCKFYYLNSEIEKIFFGGKYYQESFNFQNCIFQLNNKNIKCCCNINNDEAQQLLNNKEIKNSSFLQYPFANIECIDEETCYINTNIQFEDTDLIYKGTISSEELQNIESNNGDLYTVESNTYANNYGIVQYKGIGMNGVLSITLTDQDWENYKVYECSQSGEGIISMLAQLCGLNKDNISDDFNNMTEVKNSFNCQIKFSSLDSFVNITPKKFAFFESSDIIDGKEEPYWVWFMQFNDYEFQNIPLNSQEIEYFLINAEDISSTLDSLEPNYKKYLVLIDSRQSLGITSCLKTRYNDKWLNLLPGIILNWKGQVQKYNNLPLEKNIGDIYKVLSPTDKIQNHDGSGVFKGYNNINFGKGIINIVNNVGDYGEVVYTTTPNSNGIKILCHYIGAYDFGTDTFISKNNLNKRIRCFNMDFYITSIEYLKEENQIKIIGEKSKDYYWTDPEVIEIIEGDIFDIEFYENISTITQFRDNAIFENSYPQGKWVWNGKEWEFFDEKETWLDKIKYSSKDIETNVLPSGTLYIVYEE